jgi:hypothetical protein
MDRSFEPLTDAELQWVEDQLDRASEFVRTYSLEDLRSPLTLESLDRAFVNYLASGSDPSTANGVVLAIGAAFGTKLVEELGFRWVIVTDEFGTDLAVLARPDRGDVTIVPADFVAKRYERREAPFLVAALAEIRNHLAEIAAEWSEP